MPCRIPLLRQQRQQGLVLRELIQRERDVHLGRAAVALGGADQLEVPAVVGQQLVERVHLRPRGGEQDGLAGDIAGHGQAGGIESMTLQLGQRRLLLDPPAVTTEEVEVEADLRADRVLGGGGSAPCALAPALGGDIHLGQQRTTGRGDGFVRLGDGRIGSVEVQVAGDRLAHDLVQLRRAEHRPPVVSGRAIRVDVLRAFRHAGRGERPLSLKVVVARSGYGRSREVGADHAGRQEQGQGGKQGRPGDAPGKG